jgi:hypothetical protein
MNGNKMDTNDKDHHKRDQESNNTGLGKIGNNKHPGAKGEQQRVRTKLKENLQIMWHKASLLQKSEMERLSKLKEYRKLIKLKEEINGITEELFRSKMDWT